MTHDPKKIAFGWYGGKYSHLNWLLDLVPETNHYCEPLGGSAAVLLNRAPSPVETYNDIDGEVVNFFRVLRDQKDELIFVNAVGGELDRVNAGISHKRAWAQLLKSV